MFFDAPYYTCVSSLSITFTGLISVADTLALALISSYFTTYYHAATNIVTTGLPSAITIFAPVTQLFIDTYGWRGTMILLGGINFHCVAAGAILKPVKQTQVPYKNLKNGFHDGNVNDGDRDNVNICFKDMFNTLLFRNGSFNVLLLFQLLSGYVFNGWVVYFVSFGLSKGLTSQSAANVPLFSGIAVFIVRGGSSLVSNPPPARHLLYIGALLEGISFAGLYFADTFWTLSLASFIFGLGYGIVGSQIYIAVNDVITKENTVGAIAWIQLLHGVGYIISGYVTGGLFQHIKGFLKRKTKTKHSSTQFILSLSKSNRHDQKASLMLKAKQDINGGGGGHDVIKIFGYLAFQRLNLISNLVGFKIDSKIFCEI